MKRRVTISNVVAALAFFFVGSCAAECDCPRAVYLSMGSDTCQTEAYLPERSDKVYAESFSPWPPR